MIAGILEIHSSETHLQPGVIEITVKIDVSVRTELTYQLVVNTVHTAPLRWLTVKTASCLDNLLS